MQMPIQWTGENIPTVTLAASGMLTGSGWDTPGTLGPKPGRARQDGQEWKAGWFLGEQAAEVVREHKASRLSRE